ncbi:MAG TPA: protein kinase [Gemmatimonadales bacterium]|nr:protein kinase [Gemmatimonadales bacterium]
MNPIAGRLAAALADRYRIERELGQGGMATVYLAEDLRHDRKVAIKVLRPELAAVIGAERFLSEIKTTANLQHPHILPLFDSGAADSHLFYVMPLVQGISLRDRMAREKQLPIAEAVRIATEIAAALDYAHRHGIIHRDIKPENILLHDGSALVADFGIALAASKAGTRMTETGMSLGTPQYMSPEQAMGERELDARSDVYALGCVLYEMLTGEPPFSGPTAQAIVAKVMTAEPADVTSLRRTIPVHVADAVRTALQKLPADRFASAADFAAALGNPAFGATAPLRPGGAGRGMAAARGRAAALVPWMLVAALAVTSLWLARRGLADGVAQGTVRFAADLDQAQSLAGTMPVLLTSDGRTLVATVVSGRRNVLLARRLDSLGTRVIPGSEGATRPFLSADGRWVAFSHNGMLVKLPIEGGTPITLAESRWGGGTWGPDGTIIYPRSYQTGLWSVSASGGEARQLSAPDSAANELAHWWPQLLPGGRHVIFTAFRAPVSDATVEVLDLESGARKVLVRGGVMARYTASGHLLFARDESILAVPFDLGRLAVTGAPVVVVDDVAMNLPDGWAAYDVSASGTLAVIPASVAGTRFLLVEVDRKGGERVVIGEPERYAHPIYSPDGRRIAVDITPARGASDVWVVDLQRGGRTRITSEPASDFGALWTPDGRDLVYMSERPLFELYRRAADGSRPPARLIGGDHDRLLGSIAADGRLAAYVKAVANGSDIWTMPLTGPSEERQYLANGFQLGHPALSPDAKWMAYDSDESGRVEVYVQSFPDPTQARHQVSTGGGSEPIWTRAGQELVFRRGDTVMVTAVDPATGTAGAPAMLFAGRFYADPGWSRVRTYDVTPDGQRFLMLGWPERDVRPQVHVTMGWWPELRARVGAGGRP